MRRCIYKPDKYVQGVAERKAPGLPPSGAAMRWCTEGETATGIRGSRCSAKQRHARSAHQQRASAVSRRRPCLTHRAECDSSKSSSRAEQHDPLWAPLAGPVLQRLQKKTGCARAAQLLFIAFSSLLSEVAACTRQHDACSTRTQSSCSCRTWRRPPMRAACVARPRPISCCRFRTRTRPAQQTGPSVARAKRADGEMHAHPRTHAW
jgi:hypothetical protein